MVQLSFTLNDNNNGVYYPGQTLHGDTLNFETNQLTLFTKLIRL